MQKVVILIIGLLISAGSVAGIENVLVKEKYGECTVRVTHDACTVRVTHDATPDSKIGTLVFRSYAVVDNIHYPCEVDQAQVEHSLGLAVSRYLNRSDLKPVTSIFVGKIASFPWVRNAWDIISQSGTYPRLSHQEFNKQLFKSDLSQPFVRAVKNYGLSLSGASCEKLQFHDNGAPMDALCWFEIDER